MKKLVVIAAFTFCGCINQKEKLVGLQAEVKRKMDTMQSNKAAVMMRVQDWMDEKAWDSITRTTCGRMAYGSLQKQFENYDSLFKQLSKQYDSLEIEIKKH